LKINGTLRLLERNLPGYFNGFTQYFFERDLHIHRGSKKWPQPNAQTVAFLRKLNVYDLELYEWVLDRHKAAVKKLADNWEPPDERQFGVAKKSKMSLCFNLEADCKGPPTTRG